MIVIAGGTGRLGTAVVHLLSERGLRLRVLTRDPARAAHLTGDLVEVVAGDVRDPRAVQRAMVGAQTVISAVQGFAGTDAVGPQAVDARGNHNLIRAACATGVGHFILSSVHGAAPDYPMELGRMKFRAEQELRASGLSWTIVRATPFMETWTELVCAPLTTTGKTRLFGHGENPINFVSVQDVARFIALAVEDASMRETLVEVGGPENLTMKQFLRTFQRATGTSGRASHVPLPMMRVMAVLMRPFKPSLARQIQAGVVMDTTDMTFDPSETRRRYPSMPQTSLRDVVQRDYAMQG